MWNTKSPWDKGPSCWDLCEGLAAPSPGGQQKAVPFCCALKRSPRANTKTDFGASPCPACTQRSCGLLTQMLTAQ